jgi:hypothetical protein
MVGLLTCSEAINDAAPVDRLLGAVAGKRPLSAFEDEDDLRSIRRDRLARSGH